MSFEPHARRHSTFVPILGREWLPLQCDIMNFSHSIEKIGEALAYRRQIELP
jgi:hypothetical protein